MATSQAPIPPASQTQPVITEVNKYPPQVASPMPANANPAHYLTFQSEEITLPSTAGPIFAGNIFRPRPVHYARVTVIAMGTATKISLGNKSSQSAILDAAGETWELRAPAELRFDLNKIWVKPDTGTTTKLLVEYLE